MIRRRSVECFSVDRAGNLVREVAPERGKRYEHRCSQQSFEQVAYAADEIGGEGITLEKLVIKTGLPFTQVATALAFMKERGVLITEHRINYPACGNQNPGQVSLDAMIEYHALAEGSPGSKQPELPEEGGAK